MSAPATAATAAATVPAGTQDRARVLEFRYAEADTESFLAAMIRVRDAHGWSE